MAYETGTATDHNDLFDKLIDFLTTNTDLVADDEQWEVVWNLESTYRDGVILKGPGLSETDSVYIGLKQTTNLLDDASEIQCVGMTGVIQTSTLFNDHVNTTPNIMRLLLRTQPMDYWFTANGRRFMVMVRVSTVYEALYAGLFLPYSLPTQYPYPLAIGGTAPAAGLGGNNVGNWRSTAEAHTHYTRGFRDTSGTNGHTANMFILDPSGNWLQAGIGGGDPAFLGPAQFGTDFGAQAAINGTAGNYGYATMIDRVIPAFGNGNVLIPITISAQSPSDQTYGVLDGCYRVGGRGNAPENIITVDGQDHVVGISAFRTGIADFWAQLLGEP